MRAYLFGAWIFAAIGFAGAAYASDATTPKPMTDAEMDGVTAGLSVTPNPQCEIGGNTQCKSVVDPHLVGGPDIPRGAPRSGRSRSAGFVE